jgi:hypothetical protein
VKKKTERMVVDCIFPMALRVLLDYERYEAVEMSVFGRV